MNRKTITICLIAGLILLFADLGIGFAANHTTVGKVSMKSVENVEEEYIKIKWSKVSNADGYQVYRAESKDGTYKRIATVKASRRYYNDKKVKSGQRYYYKVRAYIKIDSKKKYGKFSSKKSGKIVAPHVPEYVLEEAKEVAGKVSSVRNKYSFVFGGVSDLHTTGSDVSAPGVKHVGQAMNKINDIAELDLIVNFGDIMVGKLTDEYVEGFKYVANCFRDVTVDVPFIQMQGNHDEDPTDTTEDARKTYYDYIGANNVGAVTDSDNLFRNYGYRDFEDKKFRVIYLNSTDVSEGNNTADCYITAEQFAWFLDTALDFSDKKNAEKWNFIVMTHHPLNWADVSMGNLLTLLDAYKGSERGSITMDNVLISYDFTSRKKPAFVSHFHGHIHNFRVDMLGTNDVLSVTIPNACFYRNNEYGMYDGYSTEIHSKYGDVDDNGKQRQFNKSIDTAEDTAFNVVVIDTLNEKIHALCYGAGIDRTITY